MLKICTASGKHRTFDSGRMPCTQWCPHEVGSTFSARVHSATTARHMYHATTQPSSARHEEHAKLAQCQRMCRWAQERRIDSRLEPADFGGIRGAAATADLEAGDIVVSVPEHCLIHEGTAAASDIVSHSRAVAAALHMHKQEICHLLHMWRAHSNSPATSVRGKAVQGHSERSALVVIKSHRMSMKKSVEALFHSQGKALSALGIAGELLLIVFSMIDRHDPDSELAPFWNSLPQSLDTGRSSQIP